MRIKQSNPLRKPSIVNLDDVNPQFEVIEDSSDENDLIVTIEECDEVSQSQSLQYCSMSDNGWIDLSSIVEITEFTSQPRASMNLITDLGDYQIIGSLISDLPVNINAQDSDSNTIDFFSINGNALFPSVCCKNDMLLVVLGSDWCIGKVVRHNHYNALNYDLRKLGNAFTFHVNLIVKDSSDCLAFPVIYLCISNQCIQSNSSSISIKTLNWILANTPTNTLQNSSVTDLEYGNDDENYSSNMEEKTKSYWKTDENDFNSDELLENICTFADQHITKSILCNTALSVSRLSALLKSYGIKTELRPYQLNGIHWLVTKLLNDSESMAVTESFHGLIRLGNISMSFQTFYDKTVSMENNSLALYYDLYTQTISFENTLGNVNSLLTESYKGSAILSDYMGLGKSLQVIGVILYLKHNFKLLQYEIPSFSETCTHDIAANSLNCVCGRINLKKKDPRLIHGIIACTLCGNRYHAFCVGSLKNKLGYKCISCSCRQYSKNLLPSSASIIVMPDNLIPQWIQEIKKHTNDTSESAEDGNDFVDSNTTTSSKGTLTKSNSQKPKFDPVKVFVYHGCDFEILVKNDLTYSDIDPIHLSTYDIILVGFNILNKEFYLSNVMETDEKRSRLRNRSVSTHHSYFPLPLLCLHYNLVVIDETQKVESQEISKRLELVSKLNSSFRLSVSGTPVGNSKLTDLKSLCYFLRISPYDGRNLHNAFKDIFISPKLPIKLSARKKWLHNLFSNLTLRRTKESVASELGLLPKRFITTFLNFTQFEVSFV